MKHLDVLKAPRSLFLFIEWFMSNRCTELHFPIVASSLWGGYSSEASSHAVSHTVGAEQELLFAMGDVIRGSALSQVFSMSSWFIWECCVLLNSFKTFSICRDGKWSLNQGSSWWAVETYLPETFIFIIVCWWPWGWDFSLPGCPEDALWGAGEPGCSVPEGIVPPTEELVVFTFPVMPFFLRLLIPNCFHSLSQTSHCSAHWAALLHPWLEVPTTFRNCNMHDEEKGFQRFSYIILWIHSKYENLSIYFLIFT